MYSHIQSLPNMYIIYPYDIKLFTGVIITKTLLLLVPKVPLIHLYLLSNNNLSRRLTA